MGAFLGTLAEHGIRHVVDVRSAPYSRHAPQYNREELAAALQVHGIGYSFEGPDLGGRPTDPSCYRRGVLPRDDAPYLEEVDYAAVMTKPWFRKGVERVLAIAAQTPTAILCSELDPRKCHRHHLIASYVTRTFPNVEVIHIVPGGTFNSRAYGFRSDEPTVVQLPLFGDENQPL